LQAVRPLHELTARDLERVYGLIWGWWGKAAAEEARVGLAPVEPVAIVRDQNIRLIKKLVQVFDEGAVVGFVLGVAGIIAERLAVDFLLVGPLPSKRKHKPVLLVGDDVPLFVAVVIPAEGGAVL
jgi:hypothetical protein